jgi:O-antigen/teichoic acid export membrane protein
MEQPPSDRLEPDPEKREQETLDRELDELNSELRTVIPGVTVLLAFLLGIPFTSVFSDLTELQSDVYFVAFLATALAVVFLMGESAYHQIRGKPYSKGRLLKTAIRQMVTALILLGISITAVVFLVTDLLFGALPAALVAAALALLIVAIWFGLPLLRRWRGDR